jgi:BlaI family penicillinase repressor
MSKPRSPVPLRDMSLRRSHLPPSEREMQVMSILWPLGSATVADMQNKINDLYDPEIARTTVLTHLRSLRNKGWVSIKHEIQAYRYYPEISLEHARWQELLRIRDLFYGGSREALLMDLVKDPQNPRWLLERVRDALHERLNVSRPSGA